jgi:hypothetical protein
MYRLIDEYGNIIDELVNPTWLKQQKRVDRPICANSYEEADGVVLSDGETMRGIAGRGMENYTPLVTVEEVSGEPYIMQQLSAMQAQVNAMQQQSTTTSEQINEIYAVQAGDTVVKSQLDAAYREGVNAYV